MTKKCNAENPEHCMYYYKGCRYAGLCEFRGVEDEITIEMLQARLKEIQRGIKENDEKLRILAELREKTRKSMAELEETVKKFRVVIE